MSWYQILLELKSPLHIGYAPLGFVQRTRYYLPARTVWGTLTVAKARKDNTAIFPDYKGVGVQIADDFKFTHFFICTKNTGIISGYDYFMPNYGDSELKYGSLSQTQFEQQFITSFGQTALAPDSLTADDESLHEKEVVSNLTMHHEESEIPRKVYLCGYVFCEKDNYEDITILEGCHVGGDRRNGLGRIGKVVMSVVKVDEKAWGEKSGITLAVKELAIAAKASFPCHVEVNEKSAGFCGDIELLRWRSWHDKNGAGLSDIELPEQCWVPGSFSQEVSLSLVPGAKGIFTIKKKVVSHNA